MSSWAQTGWLLVALAAGALLPLQAGINAGLGRHLGHPVLASLVSFGLGTFTALAVLVLLRVPVPGLAAIKATPGWAWSGGVLGMIFVTVTIFAAPKLGAATLMGTIIASQLGASLLLDHFGVAGYAERPVTLMRVLGILLIAGGVLLVQFGPGSGGSSR